MNEGEPRKSQPGHGFWIFSDCSYKDRNQVAHCSVCGMPNTRPIGNYCRWCGARMDQDSLDLANIKVKPYRDGECTD